MNHKIEVTFQTRTPTDKILWTVSDETLNKLLHEPRVQKLLLSSHRVVYCPRHGHVICYKHERKCPVVMEIVPGPDDPDWAWYDSCDLPVTCKKGDES